MIERRQFLGGMLAGSMSRLLPATVIGGAAIGLPAFPAFAEAPSRPGSRLDRMVSMIDPTLHIVNSHTKEEIRVRFFTPTGYDPNAVRQLNWIWRDWRENKVTQIDPRIFWGAAAVRASAMKGGHDGKMTLLSGFRTRKTTLKLRSEGIGAALNSMHMKSKAVDMRFHGIPERKVSGFVEWLEVGGTGHYPGSNFTHMDSGAERNWRG